MKMIERAKSGAKRARAAAGSQKGVVIIAVLWICALIMWFAIQIGAETRLQGEEQVQVLRRSQALHLAIGGCYEALGRMAQPSSLGLGKSLKSNQSFGDDSTEGDWRPDGKPHVVDYQTGQALVIVEDEAQKTNVNTASPELLKAVFERAGMKEDDAARIADLIADFVDRDDSPKLHGAEKDRYEALGLHYGPFNGPLLSLDQMLLIPGIDERLFYGYGAKSEEQDGNEPELTQVPMMPSRQSLFQMLSIYGTNRPLPQNEQGEDIRAKITTWTNGGIYRILSCGKPANSPLTSVVWLTVRFTPQSEKGYEVLYRKIL